MHHAKLEMWRTTSGLEYACRALSVPVKHAVTTRCQRDEHGPSLTRRCVNQRDWSGWGCLLPTELIEDLREGLSYAIVYPIDDQLVQVATFIGQGDSRGWPPSPRAGGGARATAAR